MTEPNQKNVGMVGLYDDPGTILRAAERVRDAGFKRWDCHTPFPVHGLDRAMGMKASPIPAVALTAGFLGLVTAVVLTGGLNAVYYPIRIAGKPMFSWQAFTPLYFELFVLFAGLGIMGSIIFFCRLGRWHSPLHDSDVMKEVTGRRFAVVLEAADDHYSEEGARALLEETGCSDIRTLVEFEEEGDTIL